jgi:hypothetical protein
MFIYDCFGVKPKMITWFSNFQQLGGTDWVECRRKELTMGKEAIGALGFHASQGHTWENC